MRYFSQIKINCCLNKEGESLNFSTRMLSPTILIPEDLDGFQWFSMVHWPCYIFKNGRKTSFWLLKAFFA
jgi:hypothetical protein